MSDEVQDNLEKVIGYWKIYGILKFHQPEIIFQSGQTKIVARCLVCLFECVCTKVSQYRNTQSIEIFFKNLHRCKEGKRRGQHLRSARVQPSLSVDAACEKLAAQKETKLAVANVEAIAVASGEEAPISPLRRVDEPKEGERKFVKKVLRCKEVNRREQPLRPARVLPSLSVDVACEELAAQKETKLAKANVEVAAVASGRDVTICTRVRRLGLYGIENSTTIDSPPNRNFKANSLELSAIPHEGEKYNVTALNSGELLEIYGRRHQYKKIL